MVLTWPRAWRLALALGLVAAAAGVSALLRSVASEVNPTPIFILAVILAAWFARPAGAGLAIVAGAVLRELVYRSAPETWGAANLLNLALFVIVTGIVAFLTCRARDRMLDLGKAFREKKEALDALERTSSLLQAISDHSKDPMFVKDTQGRFIFANPATARSLGLETPDALIGKTIADVSPAGEHARAIDAHDRDVIDSRRTMNLEEHIPIGGEMHIFQATKSPWRAAGGEVRGLIGIARDVTERTRAESALRESEARFRVLFDHSPLAKLLIDPADLTIADANARASEMFGVERHQLHRKPASEVLRAETIAALPRVTDGTGEELRIEAQTAAARDVLITARKIELAGRPLVYAALLDVTEAKQTQAELARAHEELERYSEELEARVRERTATLEASLASLEELLYTIAHDLRAPYRAAAGFAELLRIKYASQLDATALDYLGRIEAAAIRNDELILDLVEYGRLTHANVELDPLDVGPVLGEALAELSDEAKRRGASVEVQAEQWPRVIANARLLKRILVNLVSNAMKYTPPERTPRVEIRAVAKDGRGVFQVRDNGSGIDQGLAEQVFEPFIRLANSQGTAGTGMGLAIVRKAAGIMHGEVGMKSTPGEGSCFWVELPLAA